MDCKVPDEEEKKNPTKKSSSGCHKLFLIHAHHYKDSFDYDRDVNSMEIEEFLLR